MMKRKQVLIVEDELIIAEDIKFSLINSGFDVPMVVSTGQDSIRFASELKPDLILMDILLEGEMNGLEAATEIIRKNNIPIVFCSALTDERTRKLASLINPHRYITKPFEESELYRAISAVFNEN